jgi:hypothetical protein
MFLTWWFTIETGYRLLDDQQLHSTARRYVSRSGGSGMCRLGNAVDARKVTEKPR